MLVCVGSDGVLRLLEPRLRPGSRVRSLAQGGTVGCVKVHAPSCTLLTLCHDGACELRCVDPSTGAYRVQYRVLAIAVPYIGAFGAPSGHSGFGVVYLKT